MKTKQKIFVAVGLLIIIVVSAGIYINYQLDHLVASLSKPGILFTDVDYNPPTDEVGADASDNGTNTSGEPTDVKNGTASVNTPSGNASSGTVQNNDQGDIVNGVQNKLNRPLEKKDVLKAGLIIIRRLNSSEISFLFRVGSKNSYTQEEFDQVRSILRTKLTNEDIAVLKELGRKYGKELRVLDENI
ncbi:MAG: hypothetical protein ACM3NJ_00350 [Methanobacterium sp.]